MGSSDRLAFLLGFLRDRQAVGSVTPTSAVVSRAIAEFVGAPQRRAIAELGAGTGPITQALLDRLPRDGRLFAFEIKPEFVQRLRDRFDDPRLTIVPESATELPRIAREAGIERFDAVVSALPYSLLGKELTREVLSRADESMRPAAPFVALQYNPTVLLPAMRDRFGRVERRFVFWNIPPALLLRAHASGRG